MKTAKNENMMELNMKELEHAAGGVVVEINGKFWTASDPEEGYSGAYVKNPCDTLEEAQAKARKYGWSTKLYTQEEYKKTFGYPFIV